MNIFDIIGPVMIGPSSSHTAGAVRIGQIVRALFGEKPIRLIFRLHGSFAKTGKGHGTNLALLGGALGLDMANEEIRNSFKLAQAEGIQYTFEEADLGLVHPNTVQVICENDHKNLLVEASSIGAGRIEVNRIDDAAVSFHAEMNTLILFHYDKPGVVAAVSGELAHQSINIANMKVYQEEKGKHAVSVIETDQNINAVCTQKISALPHMKRVVYLCPADGRNE